MNEEPTWPVECFTDGIQPNGSRFNLDVLYIQAKFSISSNPTFLCRPPLFLSENAFELLLDFMLLETRWQFK